jgi:hypothetical protein
MNVCPSLVSASSSGSRDPGSNPAQDKNFHLWIKVVFSVVTPIPFNNNVNSLILISFVPLLVNPTGQEKIHWKPLACEGWVSTSLINHGFPCKN